MYSMKKGGKPKMKKYQVGGSNDKVKKTPKEKYTISRPSVQTTDEQGKNRVERAWQEKGDWNSPYKKRKIVENFYPDGSKKPTLTKEKFKGDQNTAGSFLNNEILRSRTKTISQKRANKLLDRWGKSMKKGGIVAKSKKPKMKMGGSCGTPKSLRKGK